MWYIWSIISNAITVQWLHWIRSSGCFVQTFWYCHVSKAYEENRSLGVVFRVPTVLPSSLGLKTIELWLSPMVWIYLPAMSSVLGIVVTWLTVWGFHDFWLVQCFKVLVLLLIAEIPPAVDMAVIWHNISCFMPSRLLRIHLSQLAQAFCHKQ